MCLYEIDYPIAIAGVNFYINDFGLIKYYVWNIWDYQLSTK